MTIKVDDLSNITIGKNKAFLKCQNDHNKSSVEPFPFFTAFTNFLKIFLSMFVNAIFAFLQQRIMEKARWNFYYDIFDILNCFITPN
jgi:hypothetical protein